MVITGFKLRQMKNKIKPWAHQNDAVDRCRDRTHYALFFEQGCGKTYTLINILRQKYEQDSPELNTLILCPQIVVDNWRSEILKFSDIPVDFITCLTGSKKNRLRDFEAENSRNGRIVITNYEGLIMMDLLEVLLAWAPDVLVLDESHKCKDMAAKRTRYSVKLSRTAKYRFLLSGTPIIKGPMDIFSQFLIMDRGETFTESLFKFRRLYFKDANAHRPKQNYFPDWRPTPKGLMQINRFIKNKSMRVLKSECLDLPPLVRQIVSFELKGEVKKVYREIENDCVSYFKDTVCSTDLAIKKAMRLHQITSGILVDDDKKLHSLDNNHRIEVLREIIELIPNNKKFIIWCVFKQNYVDVAELLASMGIRFTQIHGTIREWDRPKHIALFNDPESSCRAMVAHPGAGGIGINLTQASYAIFYTHSFSLEHDMQAEARNHRGGSEIHEKVTRIDIVAKGTIDEVVITALREKKDVSETILKYVKGE